MISTILVTIISFLICLFLMPFFIRYLKSHHDFGIERSGKRGFGVNTSSKNGTPSMGGVVFVLSSFISFIFILFCLNRFNFIEAFILLSVGLFGIIGFIDDDLKMIYHRDEGLRFLPKLFAQILVGLIIGLTLFFFNRKINLFFPFSNKKFIILYAIIEIFLYLVWFVGWSNAANFVDGIDGLLAGISLIMFIGFTIISINKGNFILTIYNFSLIGSLLAYLIFNKPKASIFMGDSGSMSLGAAMCVDVILLGNPWALIWFGMFPFLDATSVIIQVFFYHFFHFRVFPVTPLQHIFQRKGWKEWNIDLFFWAFQLIITIIGVLIWIK